MIRAMVDWKWDSVEWFMEDPVDFQGEIFYHAEVELILHRQGGGQRLTLLNRRTGHSREMKFPSNTVLVLNEGEPVE